MLTSLAAAEAIDVALPGQPLMLKWPNDVLLGGRKLAGILLERSGDRVVAGFGINLAQAPDLPNRPSAALDGAISPQAFAPLLAGTFERLLRLWRQNSLPLLSQAWMVRSHPIGTPLSVHAERDRPVSGRFEGIETDGALRLRGEDGQLHIIRAGDVEL